MSRVELARLVLVLIRSVKSIYQDICIEKNVTAHEALPLSRSFCRPK